MYRLHPAVFLDRDGVLNEDTGYPHRVEELRCISGAKEALFWLKSCGYHVIVVSNQSGVARGFFGEGDVIRFNNALNRCMGSCVDAFYYAPWHPQAVLDWYRSDHPDRKPGAGMIVRAAKEWRLDLNKSFLIGDKVTDIQAAHAAGIEGYHFLGGNLLSFVKDLEFLRNSEVNRD